MHDACHDLDQDVLRRLTTSPGRGRHEADIGEGLLFRTPAATYPYPTLPLQDVSTTAQMHLLYTRFTTVSNQLAPLLAELERRAAAHPDELSALLAECHAAYFAARKGLLVPRLIEEIKGLDPARTELVELVRGFAPRAKIALTRLV